jgi:large subunit ribosomal protein L35
MKQQINMRHNQEHMSSRRKRRLNADQVVSPADFKKLKRQLGR